MAEKRKRRRGCWGCAGCLGGMVAVAGVLLLLLIFRGPLLRAVGLRGPTAEEAFSGAPDPVATEAINNALETQGIDGVEAWVIPITGEEGQVAIFSFDQLATAGGIQTEAEAETVFLDTIRQLSATNREQDLGIEVVALDYRGENGESVLGIGAPQSAVDAYAAGEIDRRQFLAQVDVDFSNLISAAQLRELAEEEGQ